MRLEAEHLKTWRQALLLGVALAAVSGGACTKSWVLAPETGAGGVGGTALPAGSGGFTLPIGTGGFTGDHGGTGGRGVTCTTTSVDADIPKWNMLFLVGRDSSMSTRLGTNSDPSRMAAVQSQLKSVFGMYQYAINLGYLGFPSLVACPNGMACCTNGTEDAYAPPQAGAALNLTKILTTCPPPGNSMMGCTSLNDARSVAQALQAADGAFSSSSKNVNSIVIVIVDGPPGCPGDDPSTKCSAETQAVATLHNDSHGIRTQVLAIGDYAQSDPCLQQIAEAGSSTQPIAVDDTSSLTSALALVMGPALADACTVQLAPGNYDPGQLSVRISDADSDHEIPKIDFNQPTPNGWSFFSGSRTRIKISGSYCMKLQSGNQQTKVAVKLGCPPCVASQPSNCD